MARENPSQAWVVGGAVASLAILLWSLLRGRRLLGRISSGFAGAFLEAWGDIRLEKKVASLLARAEAEGRHDPSLDLARLWGKP